MTIGLRRSGLSEPYLGDGFTIRNARKGIRRYRFAIGELLENTVQHRLDGGEDIVLGDETHFHVELVEFEASVGACVLVAETGRDLEIAVEAGDHQ